MNIRGLIKVNSVNLAILGAIGLIYWVFGSILDIAATPVITGVLGIVWLIYTLYSNYSILAEDEIEKKNRFAQTKTRVQKAGRRNFFQEERIKLLRMIESVETREKYFGGLDPYSKVVELYELTTTQILHNANNACEYMETFDYVTGKDSGYVRKMCYESEVLIDKFNKLMELSVSFDDTYKDMDSREIDDMINALETMRDKGKGTLGA